MKSALLRLREAREAISPTEREIADYLLQHPEDVIDLSIHELAKRTFSSPSTIIRMCHRIGFEGFKEFRKAITIQMAIRRQNKEAEQKEITRSDSLEDIVEKITYKNIMSLEDTKNLLDTETLEKCVELVRGARMVLLFGMGASLCAAKDAYLKFLRLNKPCVINEDWHSQLLQARNTSREDLGIVISYSGSTVEVIECMKAMRENHTPIIAITLFRSWPITSCILRLTSPPSAPEPCPPGFPSSISSIFSTQPLPTESMNAAWSSCPGPIFANRLSHQRPVRRPNSHGFSAVPLTFGSRNGALCF